MLKRILILRVIMSSKISKFIYFFICLFFVTINIIMKHYTDFFMGTINWFRFRAYRTFGGYLMRNIFRIVRIILYFLTNVLRINHIFRLILIFLIKSCYLIHSWGNRLIRTFANFICTLVNVTLWSAIRNRRHDIRNAVLYLSYIKEKTYTAKNWALCFSIKIGSSIT